MNAQRPDRVRLGLALVGATVAAAVFAVAAPQSRDVVRQLSVEHDPAALAGVRLDAVANAGTLNRELADALAADDVDLANSFIALAGDRGLAVDSVLAAKVAAENTAAATAARTTQHFVRGFFKGEPDDPASLAGTAAGDLMVIGDVRDAAREGTRLYKGEQADELVLGLACLGIAVTAGTYATWGAAAPARAAMTLVKAARKSGRISAPLGMAVTRAVRESVDTAKFRNAVTSVSLRDPAVALRAARDAVKVERSGQLSRMIGDVARVQARAGTAATLDGVRLAQGGRDLTRLATLAEKEGSKTRAILKFLGGAAIAALTLTFEASSWLFTAVFAIIGFCCAVKGIAERTTWRYLRSRKLQRS
jgi:hypothetical protein